MTLTKYITVARVLLLALALYLFAQMRIWVLLAVAVLAGLVIFFAPIEIASRRRHRNYWPIVILTFLCWPVALVWSLMDNRDV